VRLRILKYFYQYLLAALIFLVALILERSLSLYGLSTWLLIYLLVRKVSFKTVYLLSVFSDLISLRVVGSTGLVLSLIVICQMQFRLRKIWLWLLSAVFISLLQTIERGELGWGFALSSTIFLFIFLVLLPIKSLVLDWRTKV